MVALSRALISRVLLAATLLVPMALPSAASAEYAEYAVDAYEAAGDDMHTGARDLTSLVDYVGSTGWYGQPVSQEAHTFDLVDGPNAKSDEDWIRLQVTAESLGEPVSYFVEAVSVDANVDPVVELYGPVTTADEVTPTAPGMLPVVPVGDGFMTDHDPNAQEWNDDGPYFSMLSSSISFIPDAVGWYYIRIRPYYHAPTQQFNGAGRYTLRVKTGQVTRLAGDNRIDTAIAISRERFSSIGPVTNAVVIANANGFADALAGSTLAGRLGCPVLLTPSDTLPSSVANEIRRLRIPTGGDWEGAPQPQTVYILGGPTAVSWAVQRQISDLGAAPMRVAGPTRTATARVVTEKAAQIPSTKPFSSVAFLVSSRDFPDALAASPMAAYNHASILMTPGDVLDANVEAVLKNSSLGIKDVVIVGGTSVISTQVQNRVAALLGGDSRRVRRIWGANRFQTARNFSAWATGMSTATDRVGTIASPTALETLDFQRIGVASGEDFPDALAGGVFCGLAGSPILLTESARVSPYLLSDYWTTTTGDVRVPVGQDYWWMENPAGDSPVIMRSYIFGGAAAVSNDVLLTLDVFTGSVFPAEEW